ncbi:MAG: hypothetical protein EXR77_07195 [Myxococcales bacterium]|nr:hypothetical protein [Myxococcales bacterium]
MTTYSMLCAGMVLNWAGFGLVVLASIGVTSCKDAGQHSAADAAVGVDAVTVADSAAAKADAAADLGEAPPNDSVATDPFGDPACDPLQPLTCAMPFPSSHFQVEDKTTATGWRLQFAKGALPKNNVGVQVDTTAYQRLDGFSVAASLVVQFPNVDTVAMAGQKSIDKSVDKASPIVWLEVDKTGAVKRRVAHFAELDVRPNAADKIDPTTQVLFVRPAVILDYATRNIVAFRQLKDTKGGKIARSPAFAALIEGKTAGTQLAKRQARFDEIFAILAKEGIAKDELTLAWDFSTYSQQALHGPLLQMRDKALAAIGDQGAALTFTTFAAKTDGSADPDIAHTLRGTFKAPNFMKDLPGVGADTATCPRWNFNAAGVLEQNGWRDAQVWIRVPKTAMDGTAHDLLHYGHGLNGSGDETYQGWVGPNASTNKFIYFANSMIGMSNEDSTVIFQILQDLSRFSCLPERVTAGVVEHLVLQRTMKLHGPAIISAALSKHLGKPIEIKSTGKMFWQGNSQGGIYGQTVLAAAQDVTRGHFGQPGLNYHLLLERSVDFDEFSMVLSAFYAKRSEYVLLLSLIQNLWDYVDPITFVRHLEAEPFADTPKHHALSVVHPGDFQVDAVTVEVAMRSGYYKVLPFYGKPVPMVAESAYPVVGSGVVSYDFGNSWFIQGNMPPGPEGGFECGDAKLPHAKGPCLGKGLCDPKGTFKPCTLNDPHDRAHGLKSHNDQMRHFFDTGEIKDFCGGDGCKPE